ncbi:hypothetical protein V2J09_004304 [Rumex salicifolius]
MAIAPPAVDESEARLPLISDDSVDGAVDYKGRPIIRSRYGGWRSAWFIIGVELAERVAYYGIASNLITYLTGPLGQSTAVAAANVNAWSGMISLLPLVGAVVADSFLGRFRTIVVSSLIYILGLGLLTVSAMLPFTNPFDCITTKKSSACEVSHLQMIFFFFSLYLVAIGQGGHKPCVQAFGADQFDASDPNESKAKSSFFNWWYFGICMGPLFMVAILNYIQDNLNWALGFGIPCLTMVLALLIFLLGSAHYRYIINGEEKSPFVRIGLVFVSAGRNRHAKAIAVDVNLESQGFLPGRCSEQFRFLNKALVAPDGSKEGGACSLSDVEEAKAVLRLFPIWASSLIYAVVFAQSSTFFTKQGLTMDRSITPTFSVPAASLQSFITLFIVCFIPVYDCIFVPVARSITGKPAGITVLQRIASGMLISTVAMAIAAVIEGKRIETALEHGIIDSPGVPVPMSIWWLVPQYALFGIADVFTMVGLQEFFYDQVPTELRSVGLSLYLSIFGIGSLMSSFIVSSIDKITSGDGRDSWFADNLNRAHLHYFYWLLAGASAVGLSFFMFFARSYIYNSKNAS